MTRMLKSTLGAVANLCNVSLPSEQMSLSLLYIKAIQLLSSASAHHTKYPYHIGKY